MSDPGASARRIWIDGSLVPWAEATVHVLAHSHQRGSLVFDYLSVHATERGPAVFRLREHAERLLASAALVGLPLEPGVDEVVRATLETVRANPGATAVKISAYLASVELDVVPADPHVTLAVAAYDPVADVLAPKGLPAPKRRPIQLWLEKERRNRRPDILEPQAKVAANYASPMVAKWAARRRGYDEVLLVDEHGDLAEAPTSNLFLVDAEGVLRTPPEHTVLHGITRRSVLELAKHDGLPAVEASLRPEDLFAAPEAFLTSTSVGVLAVASVDGQALGVPAPGPTSRALSERFDAVTEGRDPAFHHWLAFVEEA